MSYDTYIIFTQTADKPHGEGKNIFKGIYVHGEANKQQKGLGIWVITEYLMRTNNKWTAARSATCQLYSDTSLVVSSCVCVLVFVCPAMGLASEQKERQQN